MERRQGRQIGAEEKLKIVEEGRQAGGTISEVCRRHQIATAQFYEWERRARQAALAGLARKRPAGRGRLSVEEELRAEIGKLREVVIALTRENVSLKKGEPLN
jgi:transposase-like protein